MEHQAPISKPETAAPTEGVVGVDVPPLVLPLPGFTPGPWHVGNYTGETNNWWVASEETRILGAGRKISEANARLISAAPEMVAELIQCEAILSLGPWNGTLDRVREVLTKALGSDWQNETSAGTASK